MIQRVVRYPVLTKSNYTDWALLIKVKLKARALWTAKYIAASTRRNT